MLQQLKENNQSTKLFSKVVVPVYFIFLCSKIMRAVTVAMKLKVACSLAEKL